MMNFAIYDTETGKLDGWYSDRTDPESIIEDAEQTFGVQHGRLQVISATSHFAVPKSQILRLPPT